jgi:hypothetical protein
VLPLPFMNNRIKLTQIERYYFYIIIVSYFGYFYNLISRARWFREYFMKKGGAFGRKRLPVLKFRIISKNYFSYSEKIAN